MDLEIDSEFVIDGYFYTDVIYFASALGTALYTLDMNSKCNGKI